MSSDPVRAWLSRPEALTQLRKYVATYQAPHITADELVSACIERMLERAETFTGDIDKVSAWGATCGVELGAQRASSREPRAQSALDKERRVCGRGGLERCGAQHTRGRIRARRGTRFDARLDVNQSSWPSLCGGGDEGGIKSMCGGRDWVEPRHDQRPLSALESRREGAR